MLLIAVTGLGVRSKVFSFVRMPFRDFINKVCAVPFWEHSAVVNLYDGDIFHHSVVLQDGSYRGFPLTGLSSQLENINFPDFLGGLGVYPNVYGIKWHIRMCELASTNGNALRPNSESGDSGWRLAFVHRHNVAPRVITLVPLKPDPKPSAFSVDGCIRTSLGGIGGPVSGVRRLVGGFQLLFHRLPLLFNGLPLLAHDTPLFVSEPRENSSEDRNHSREDSRPPIGRRFFLAVCSGLALIPNCYFGTRLRKGGRRGGGLLIGCGFLLFWLSLLLFWLTGFSWSWGRPL